MLMRGVYEHERKAGRFTPRLYEIDNPGHRQCHWTVINNPGVAYILGPVLKGKQGEEWIHLGSTTKVETDSPTLFKVHIQRQAGWVTDEEELAVYVLTEDGQNFIAMSNVCTHLGCRVRWVAEQNKFFCPCHNGVFDMYGNVLSGPPPCPLDR